MVGTDPTRWLDDPVARCLTAATGTLAVVLPLALGTAWLAGDARVLELRVLLAVCAIGGGGGALVGAWWALRDADERWRPGILLCAGAVALAAWQIGQLVEVGYDYRLQEQAARRLVVDGRSLYDGSGHTNLPPVLLGVAGLRLALGWVSGNRVADDLLWRGTYVLYQLQQLVSIIAIIGGLYTLARRAGGHPFRAAVLGGAATFALPLHESIGNSQINLFVLALAIGALLAVERRPALAGVLVSVGGAVKLYPLALLAEWVVSRRWHALAWWAGATGILVAATWTHWQAYVGFLTQLSPWDDYRHTGLHAILMNTTRDIATAAGAGEGWRQMAGWVWALSIAAVGALMVRMLLREQARPAHERRPLTTSSRVMASVLLVFPLAWAHHFVFALPLVVCLWAERWPPPRILLGTALVAALPAYDIYPLGAHRLLGLVLLLVP